MTRLIPFAFAALVAACSPAPTPWLAAPADPAAPGRALPASSVTAGASSFTPAEPKGWEELNESVTPRGAKP